MIYTERKNDIEKECPELPISSKDMERKRQKSERDP